MQKRHAIKGLKSFFASSRVCLLLSAALLLAAPATGYAQSTNDVTLRFADGQDSVSGVLSDFRDGKYFIETSIGLLAIPSDGVSCEGSDCPNLASLEPESTKLLVEAKNGTFTFAGELLEIDDGAYVLNTAVGVQRIPINLVNCEGERCVVPTAEQTAKPVIELTNGKITLKGELLSFQDQIYTLNDERMGKIQVGAVAFKCLGANCP